MYRTCAFCNAALRGDGGPSGLGVGRRLAFDEWRGRLWVVCPSCARWNLTPLDDRLDKIEAVARAAREGRVLAASPQVALIRWQGYELVRVGQPPRVELAAWRYGERLRARARERARVVVPLTVAAVGLGIAANVAVGGSFGVFLWNFGRVADWAYVAMLGNRRVTLSEPLLCEACGAVIPLRARHVQHARLLTETRADLALLLRCPRCGGDGTLLTGADAAHALRRGLTFLNSGPAARRRAETAAREVDRAGGPEGLIRDASLVAATVRSLRPERRLALEIAVDELAEVTALERQWFEAEQIAEIADGMLSTTPELEDHLRRLKARASGDQPDD
jgi:hypothetical protein